MLLGGVHGLLHLFFFHFLDQQLGHQHLKRGIESKVFNLEVGVRDIPELPVLDAVVFMSPLDVVTFVEFVRLVDWLFFDLNCNFEQHVVGVVFA